MLLDLALPDLVGHELVRVDEDLGRTCGMAASEARRRLGQSAVPAHHPRRGVPAGGLGGGDTVTLRTRLLASLTYVLLLAIVALGVPLAISLSARVKLRRRLARGTGATRDAESREREGGQVAAVDEARSVVLCTYIAP